MVLTNDGKTIVAKGFDVWFRRSSTGVYGSCLGYSVGQGGILDEEALTKRSIDLILDVVGRLTRL